MPTTVTAQVWELPPEICARPSATVSRLRTDEGVRTEGGCVTVDVGTATVVEETTVGAGDGVIDAVVTDAPGVFADGCVAETVLMPVATAVTEEVCGTNGVEVAMVVAAVAVTTAADVGVTDVAAVGDGVKIASA